MTCLPIRIIFSLWIACMSVESATAQVRCGFEEPGQRSSGRSKNEFESWLSAKRQAQSSISVETQYHIRVVVHVIHNGESAGTGSNIPDEQIISQIAVLNEDYQGANADAVNTPPEFQPLAGAAPIYFELATSDPIGRSTTGIVRVNGGKETWSRTEEKKFKSLSYWPAENYLNIWVCNLTGYIGYAQFPVSELEGLSEDPSNRLTDGVVISYLALGSVDDGPFNLLPEYNKGRTATHEVAHFFGLRHVWGDVMDCEGTDYVDDTPPQSNPTIGCPTHPQKECPATDPVSKMFQNFLDTSDDVCMSLFTKGQVERMTTVLNNSPRRRTLLNTDGTTLRFPKIFSPNDDGINDTWTWENTSFYQGCDLFIYDKFGKLVFEANSYDNSWRGTDKSGKKLVPDAYYFLLKCNERPTLSGGVRIIK